MAKKIFFSFFLISFHYLYAQDAIKKYVQENAVPISSIEPDSLNYDDLKVIGNAIGDSKIVMLGEQDHGDAPTFLAKTRLIKYLHEKKGFDVLAFESDFFGLNEGSDQLPKEKNGIDSFLRKNIFPIWTLCDACENLFYKYVPLTYTTSSPLIISGFDCQTYLSYSSANLTHKLDSVLKNLNISFAALSSVDSMTHLNTLPRNNNSFESRSRSLNELKRQLQKKLAQNDFWIMVLDNLAQLNLEYQYATSDPWRSFSERDSQMAANLKWLVEQKYAGKKIIVWAQNFHVSKYGGHYKEKVLNKTLSMGAIYDSIAQYKAYTIGFTSYQGTAGRIIMDTFKVDKPKSSGFENWINKNWQFGFIDFTGYNKVNTAQEKFYLKGSISGLHQNQLADWNKIFDGIFYIRDMYPCKRIR